MTCTPRLLSLLLIYAILRDLSNPCFGLQPNSDYTRTDLAVWQEVNAFSPPKFSLKKSYLRNKRHFGLSRDASVLLVTLSRDVLLVTLLLQCNDVSLNPGPPVKLSVENFTRSRGLKIAHLNVRSLIPKLDSLKILLENNLSMCLLYQKPGLNHLLWTTKYTFLATLAYDLID